jgi:hypothetical protein
VTTASSGTAEPGEEHPHLFAGRVLRPVLDHERVVQRAPRMNASGGDLDLAPLAELLSRSYSSMSWSAS